jgi:hypothetical protein
MLANYITKDSNSMGVVMKYLILCFLMTSIFTSLSFAGETTTDCPMMREANDRSNPKANLDSMKPKPKKTRGSSAQ